LIDRPSHGALRAAAAIPYLAVLGGIWLLDSVWVAVLAYHLGIVVALIASGRLGLFRDLARGWSAGLALGVGAALLLAGPAIYLCWPLMRLDGVELGAALAGLGVGGPALLPLAAYATLANPWFEEALWRGLLLSRRSGPAIEDVLFAGYHALVLVEFLAWPWIVACVAALVIAAWIWRRLALRTGGLLVPALTHLAVDIGIVGGVVAVVGWG
jgi:membrane protease YdiL (CAAX protease family)